MAKHGRGRPPSRSYSPSSSRAGTDTSQSPNPRPLKERKPSPRRRHLSPPLRGRSPSPPARRHNRSPPRSSARRMRGSPIRKRSPLPRRRVRLSVGRRWRSSSNSSSSSRNHRRVRHPVGSRRGRSSSYSRSPRPKVTRKVSRSCSTRSMQDIMSDPKLVRNVALVGHLQHGKTIFMDMLVESSHQIKTENSEKCMRFDDALVENRGKKMSSKAIPNSLILEDSNSQCYMCNIIDTPGHVDFSDELTAALRLVDGVVLIVDVAEGVRMNTVRAIQHAIRDRLKIVVVLNKVDSLLTKPNLSLEDAYQILARIIETINEHIKTNEYVQPINPANGNLCFASGCGGWCFTLHSYAKKYVKDCRISYDVNKLASQLWGDFLYDNATDTYIHQQPSKVKKRSFVELFLEPLYKIYTKAYPGEKIEPKSACKLLFGSETAFIEMLVRHIPSAKEAASVKLENIFSEPKDDKLYIAMEECDQDGPLMVNITKLYPNSDYSRFDALGRVYSGKICKGDFVHVLIDEDGMTLEKVTKLWIHQAGKSIPLEDVYSGSLVVIEGVSESIKKTATLCGLEYYGQRNVFRPLQFNSVATMKYIVQSLDPYLPTPYYFNRISKGYPLAVVSLDYKDVAISGTGKLYLDSIMKDFKELIPEVVKFKSSPFIQFCETVDSISRRCSYKTDDGTFEMTMIAEQLDTGAAEDIENNVVSLDCPRKKPGSNLETKCDWNLLAAKPIWAFGPEKQGPNILLDDTNLSDDGKKLLDAVKDHIVSGFQKGAYIGPSCSEPIRNVKFRIVDAVIDASMKLERRKVVKSIEETAVCLTRRTVAEATRLMEPVQYMEIQTPKSCVSAVLGMLSGNPSIKFIEAVELETGDCIVKASLPLIETNAFENKLRNLTEGQAFCLSTFDHWEIVPGKPLIKGTKAEEYVAEIRCRKQWKPFWE